MTLPILFFVRGGLVLAVALVMTRLARRSPASLRHAVLATALVGVLAIPAIELAMPTVHAGAIAAEAPQVAVVAALPVAEAGPRAVSHVAPLRAPTPVDIPWGAIACALWLAGVAALLARTGIGAWRARRIASRGTPIAADARGAWRQLGGRGEPPRVVASDEVEAPIVVGAIAPVVVVPRSASSWDAARWRVVLLHELAHVRRRDGVANLVAQVACAVHWLDPLAWIAARWLREERELAADDAVLAGGARASTYAEHLVAIATAHPAPAAALAMTEPSRFEARVAALLDGERARGPAGLRTWALAGALGVVAAGAACVSPETAPARVEPAGSAAAPSDIALQGAAEDELAKAMATNGATGGIAIVLDAKTGNPLAIATRGDGDARAVRSPGSTMKPFTFAAALEAGVVDTGSHVDCENGSRKYGDQTLTDASQHGVLDLGQVLAVSSNVCTAKIAEPLGDKLGDALRKFHFGAPAHVDTHSLAGASIASGEGIQASALDVATGYTTFVDGSYRGSERVMSADTAHAIVAMMERVVDDPEGTGHAAHLDGVRVAGKTGTSHSAVPDHYYASFVGIVPADAPRFVVLVGFDGVTGAGGKVAAPVFASIAARALAR